MKLILSRKGTDSAAGGLPSIILPNNKIVSIPIPGDDDEKITYDDVYYCKESKESLAELIAKVSKNIHYGKNKKMFSKEIKCHLDPDINVDAYLRSESWRGSFGQIGAAQTVLTNAHVSKGDIFLFFGWFNRTYFDKEGQLKYCKGDGFHMIYGWLEVERKIYTKNDPIPDWLEYHPHMNNSKRDNANNCIYIGTENLTIDNKIKGYGVFEKYDDSLVLTKNGMSRSKWDLPDIFQNKTITYHNENSWKTDYFQSAFRGQEFVCQENVEISNWVKEMIKSNVNQ